MRKYEKSKLAMDSTFRDRIYSDINRSHSNDNYRKIIQKTETHKKELDLEQK